MIDRLCRRAFDAFCLSAMATCLVILVFGDQSKEEMGFFGRFVFAITLVSAGAWIVLLFAKLWQDEKRGA